MQRRFLDFENPGALSDIDYRRLIRISGANFDKLFSYVKNEICSTLARSARTCIAILLMKLRTRLFHSIVSIFFGLPRKIIDKAIHFARKTFLKCFVLMHLGLDYITRDNFIKEHTRNLARFICRRRRCSNLSRWDIEKSSNYSFQRRTYST